MPTKREPDPSADIQGLVVYLATMSASMAKLARQNRLDALAYLLELAHLEAETVRLQTVPSRATGTND